MNITAATLTESQRSNVQSFLADDMIDEAVNYVATTLQITRPNAIEIIDEIALEYEKTPLPIKRAGDCR